MNKLLLFSPALILLFLTIQPVSAALVEADWLVAGDSKLTVDTNSGFEWLDLTESTGLSMNEVLSGVGGFLDMGFRYATTSEISELFAAAGISDTTGDSVPENVEPVIDLLLLMGITFEYVSSGGNNIFSSGYHLPDPPDLSGRTLASAFQLISSGNPPLNLDDSLASAVIATSRSLDRDFSEWFDGSYLVRETTVVPLPAAFWLFVSGLLGLIGISKHKIQAL